MVTAGGHIKVLDFGLAKLREEDGRQLASVRERVTAPKQQAVALALDVTMPIAVQPRARGDARPRRPDELRDPRRPLLGTPLYMAPEQIAGAPPDERSEVFSVGVLAYELLTGKPPYTATLDGRAVRSDPSSAEPALDGVPDAGRRDRAPRAREGARRSVPVDGRVARRRRRGARRRSPRSRAGGRSRRRGAAGRRGARAGALWSAHHAPCPRRHARATSTSSARSRSTTSSTTTRRCRRCAPRCASRPIIRARTPTCSCSAARPRPIATRRSPRRGARPARAAHSKDRALLDAAIAYAAARGPARARAALAGAGAPTSASSRSGPPSSTTAPRNYATAQRPVQGAARRSRARVPRPDLRSRLVGAALPRSTRRGAARSARSTATRSRGEADAVGVYATTLAAAGKLDDAVAAAQDALRLNEGEDTLAGLAQGARDVHGRSRTRARSRSTSARSIAPAPTAGRSAAPRSRSCSGSRATPPPRSRPCSRACPAAPTPPNTSAACACSSRASSSPAHAETIAHELDALAAEATPTHPAYGAPATLAKLVRVRAHFFGGACVAGGPAGRGDDPTLDAAYTLPLDFYGAYHVPLFAT